MKIRHLATALALACTLSAASAFGESMWVKSASVDVRSGKGAVYPSTGKVAKGTQVTVVSRDSGWVQVTAGSLSGWVFEGALSATKVGEDISFGGANAQMSTAAAARGLQPDAEAYVANRRMDKTAVERLIAIRQSIAPQEFEKFNADVHK
jgi:uncharacterized protein YraI